jgi:hypothetical protein
VGHQDYFVVPLPGSEALLKSGIGKGNFRCEYCFYFCVLFYIAMENSPFGSLFGNTTATITVVDEAPPAQLDPFKIPMKIVEHVINNRYSGDGTVHPGDHLLFIHELCELFKCAGISSSQVKRKLFSLSLKGRAAEWYRMLKDGPSIGWEEIVPLFYSKFYPPIEIHKDRNQIYNFWPHDEESIAQAWERLKSLMLKCPIHELPRNIVINNFYARLTLHDKDLLDASCSGSFTRIKEEAKWDLLDCIQENTEGWENDKGRKSGINYDYECIKAFMGTNDFHNISVVYGLDSQILANYFKAFASYLDVPKKDWSKYHAPYKDIASCAPARPTEVCTVDRILPELYFEKMPFPAKVKGHSTLISVLKKSAKKAVEPDEQIAVKSPVAIVKDLVTKNVEDGHTIFCEDASNIVSHPSRPRKTSVPLLSVRIGDHCYYGLCDIAVQVQVLFLSSFIEKSCMKLVLVN